MDSFVAKLDGAGNHIWSKSFGSNGNDEALAVVDDGNDEVFVTGYLENDIDFGGGLVLHRDEEDLFLI